MKIIIATHGNLGRELINTAHMIVGDVDNLFNVSLNPGDNIDKIHGFIEEHIKKSKMINEEVIILTDLFHGTPFNKTLELINKYTFHHFTGVNLAMLLELIMVKKNKGSIDEVLKIVEIGKKSIFYVNDYLKE